MFAQFFGNFLLNKKVVTPEQLLCAIKEQEHNRVKLGTLAIHAGLMTSGEVEKVVIMQTHEDKLFGELAIEMGYLTQEQVHDLLNGQTPDYLLLGQTLIEQGLLTNSSFERLLTEYQSEQEILDFSDMSEQSELIDRLICNLCQFSDMRNIDLIASYLKLFFNNLIRFIGGDFTPLNVVSFREYLVNQCAAQDIRGSVNLFSALDMELTAAIAFASRYTNEEFKEFDEYVTASMEDFLNLHNGLFSVNMSNLHDIELTLEPPVFHRNEILTQESTTYTLPVIFPFGVVNFVFSIMDV